MTQTALEIFAGFEGKPCEVIPRMLPEDRRPAAARRAPDYRADVGPLL
ncbi:MAG: hypothetical protein ABIF71_00555 [Planctomycetota bacterium]